MVFSPGTPASSTNKTGRHDIAEILLKVVLNTKIHIQIQTRSVIGRIVMLYVHVTTTRDSGYGV